MSLLSIVASSSAFCLPASPPPKGSSIDSDWSTKNKKQPGFLRLISAWYGMVFLHFVWHHENDSHMPEVTGWSPVLIPPTGRTRRDPDHLQLASFGAVLGAASTGRARCVAYCSRCFVPFSSLGPSRPRPRSLPKTRLLTPPHPFACGRNRSRRHGRWRRSLKARSEEHTSELQSHS